MGILVGILVHQINNFPGKDRSPTTMGVLEADTGVCEISDEHNYNKIKKLMRRVMSKPAFCICENKEADQLCSN